MKKLSERETLNPRLGSQGLLYRRNNNKETTMILPLDTNNYFYVEEGFALLIYP